MSRLLRFVVVLSVGLVAAALSSACASTSTLAIPSCADRVEIEGQHSRAGSTLLLDHALDPPWSTTKLVLQSGQGSRVVTLDNRTPDLPRLLAGCGVGAVGCGVGALGLSGGGPGAVGVGGVVGAAGAAVALTGWHPGPGADADLEAWCAETSSAR
jgi:hypothetical protein